MSDPDFDSYPSGQSFVEGQSILVPKRIIMGSPEPLNHSSQGDQPLDTLV